MSMLFSKMPILSCFKTCNSSKNPVSCLMSSCAPSAKSKQHGCLAKTRIEKELKDAIESPTNNCSVGPVGDDIFKLQGIIIGPSGTPFEGGVFYLSIHLSDQYPFKPPKIKFLTKVLHPNISKDGTILVDILGTNWSPALSMEKLLLSICSFLADGNAEEDPFNPVCILYKTDRNSYNQKAREWTIKYAIMN